MPICTNCKKFTDITCLCGYCLDCIKSQHGITIPSIDKIIEFIRNTEQMQCNAFLQSPEPFFEIYDESQHRGIFFDAKRISDDAIDVCIGILEEEDE